MFGQLTLLLVAGATLVSALLSGGAAWVYQDNRYEAKIARMEQQAAELLRETEKRYAHQLIAAESKAKERERKLRADADLANSTADGLRNDLARALAAAQSSPAACLERATAFANVLEDMERAGRAMAAACDRHVNDIRTLTEAWPQSK